MARCGVTGLRISASIAAAVTVSMFSVFVVKCVGRHFLIRPLITPIVSIDLKSIAWCERHYAQRCLSGGLQKVLR